MDFLTIEVPNSDKDVNIMVVMDHLTWFAQAFVTCLQVSSLIAKAIWDTFFMIYGFPEKILSDQGHNFERNLIQELCRLAQVKKLRTTPYRPQTSGQCKWFNGTLISMIGTLDPKVKWHWHEEIPSLMHVYNYTRNNATGYSPHFLMFRHKPPLPIDIEFGVHAANIADVSSAKYAAKIQKWMKWAFQQVNTYNEKETVQRSVMIRM